MPLTLALCCPYVRYAPCLMFLTLLPYVPYAPHLYVPCLTCLMFLTLALCCPLPYVALCLMLLALLPYVPCLAARGAANDTTVPR